MAGTRAQLAIGYASLTLWAKWLFEGRESCFLILKNCYGSLTWRVCYYYCHCTWVVYSFWCQYNPRLKYN